jgi:hypothetical protein
LLGTVVLLTGCGGGTAPADEVPLLADRLAGVDRAVSSGDEAQIREQVEALVNATERARGAGQLDDEQAERVLAAADSLLAQLPDETTPQPSPSPRTSSPAPPSTPEEGDDEDSDENDEDDGHEEGHEKHPEKDQPKPEKPKKAEKGKGHGH